MKVYIAGPMRGLPEWNFPAFDRAQERWQKAGWHVMSPAAMARAMNYGPDCGYIAEPSDKEGLEHLKHVMLSDIAAIYACDALAILPGWENSVGTTVELAIAQYLGLPIYNAETMKIVDVPKRPWKLYNTVAQSARF